MLAKSIVAVDAVMSLQQIPHPRLEMLNASACATISAYSWGQRW